MKKILLLSALLIFACTSDDSDSTNDPSLIGKWYLNTADYFIDDSLFATENVLSTEVNGCRSYLEFKTNQSYEVLSVSEGYSDDITNYSGNWDLNNNIVTLYRSSDPIVCEIMTINNTELVIKTLCEEESLENPNGCIDDIVIINYYEKYD